ncbi:MAG: D,D-heptose 1,7-bisphosphate phosphatase [Cyanobacteria bacterium RYN_339]|nr:D,D-heptose 1,7-bisphosphate phosphatase [Cyanobacteria bacterium RYN_339]
MGQHKTAVFLDRDGTINVEAGYIRDLAQLQLMPGAAAAVKRLNDQGIPVFVATNQSGPARGYYPESHVLDLNRRLTELLAAEDARVDDVFYCPHLPEGTVAAYTQACDCRKPEPGMLLEAARKHGLDLAGCYMVGDKSTDVEVGQRVGCRTVLLKSGYGEAILKGEYMWPCTPDHVADTLVEAVTWMLDDMKARG